MLVILAALLLMSTHQARADEAPATSPTTQEAAASQSMGFNEDPTKPGVDPSGLDFTGSLYKPNAWLGGWSAGGAKKEDGSDFQPFGFDEKGQPAKPTVEALVPMLAHAYYSINMTWALVAGFLVMFMQAGFALVETGLCRAKNAAHTMSMNFLVYALGMTGFFVCGYAFMCGGANAAGGATIGGPGGLGGIPVMNQWLIHVGDWGILGGKGFFLSGQTYNASAVVWFLFMMVFMDTTATIPTGALAERWNFKSFFIYSLFIGAILYPTYGCWVWGGGWLAQLGMKMGWGHGGVDYAGSSVVHMQGGVLGLVCSMLLGPRIGKYDENGKPKPILGHHIPMVMLGTFILAFGWFGFNAGSSLAASDSRIGVIAVNTMLASAAGALASCLYMWLRFGKPDPSMMCNGMLAGLVAITAPCAFVTPWAAFLIGAIAGVLVVWSVFFWEKIGIDDCVGAISVHGVNGLWGILALGLFADGTYGQGYNGIGVVSYLGVAGRGVTGLFYGDSKQFMCQCIMGVACFTWNFCAGGAIFWLVGKVVGGNRVPPEVEIAGLDIPEMGAPGYPEFITAITPDQVSPAEIAAAKAALARA
jgi:Amt family ammonium transporter